MNKKFSGMATAIAASLMIFAGSACGYAADSQSNQSTLGSTITNLIQGVLSTSNLQVSDICGEWTADGSAVSFKTENLLKKAGGIAAASAIEAKINPYFEKLGLNKAVLTVNDDNTFTLAVNSLKISGTIATKDSSEGTFVFTFKVVGMQLGSLDTYISKSINHLDVMFDADKLMTLVSSIAKLTGNSTASTLASLVDSYDGLCLGFSMNKTGSTESTSTTSTSSGLGGLLQNVLGGSSSSSESTESTTTTEESESSSSSVGTLLNNLIKKK